MVGGSGGGVKQKPHSVQCKHTFFRNSEGILETPPLGRDNKPPHQDMGTGIGLGRGRIDGPSSGVMS